MSENKAFNARNARTPKDNEKQYVIAAGAPNNCYVDGYGLVGPGKIVTYAPGVDPSKWAVEVNPEDAAKAASSEADAQRLAVMAAAKIKAGGNSQDRQRKQVADEAAHAQRMADEQAAAQREADGIARVAAADAKAKEAADAAEAATARTKELEAQLEKANQDLAAAQSQLEKHAVADADKKDGKQSGSK